MNTAVMKRIAGTTERRRAMRSNTDVRSWATAFEDVFANVSEADMTQARAEFKEVGEVAGKPTQKSVLNRLPW